MARCSSGFASSSAFCSTKAFRAEAPPLILQPINLQRRWSGWQNRSCLVAELLTRWKADRICLPASRRSAGLDRSDRGRRASPVTTLDDPVERVTWSPTDEWLAFCSAPGGMNQQIYLIRPDGTDLQRLTDGGTDNNWIGRWNPTDGTSCSALIDRIRKRRMPSFMSMVQGLRLIAKNTGIGWLTDFSRDRTKAVLWQMQNRSDSNLYLLDVVGDASGSANKTILTPHNPPGSFSGGLFSPDGRSIYISTNKDRDLAAFGRVILGEDGKPGPIEILAERRDAELESFDLSRDGQTAALLWNVSGRNELCFLDLRPIVLTKVPELPSGVATDLSFSPDGNRLALSLSTRDTATRRLVHRYQNGKAITDHAQSSSRNQSHGPG